VLETDRLVDLRRVGAVEPSKFSTVDRRQLLQNLQQLERSTTYVH